MAFGSSSTLTVHKSVHTGEKPFECIICKKTFGQIKIVTSVNIKDCIKETFDPFFFYLNYISKLQI